MWQILCFFLHYCKLIYIYLHNWLAPLQFRIKILFYHATDVTKLLKIIFNDKWRPDQPLSTEESIYWSFRIFGYVYYLCAKQFRMLCFGLTLNIWNTLFQCNWWIVISCLGCNRDVDLNTNGGRWWCSPAIGRQTKGILSDIWQRRYVILNDCFGRFGCCHREDFSMLVFWAHMRVLKNGEREFTP